MSEQIRIACVDDHWAVADGTLHRLGLLIPLAREECVAFATVPELLAQDGEFDVVLLDVRLDDGSTPEENVWAVTERGWPVVLLTQDPRPVVLARCLRAGALGVVGKKELPETLAAAVVTVAGGEDFLNADWAAAVQAAARELDPKLSGRELEIVRLTAAGLLVHSIARRLEISEESVKTYLRRAREKYAKVGRPSPTATDIYRRAVEDGHIDGLGDV